METYFEKSHKIEFNDCYPNGKISYTSLIKYLQDTAWYHSEKGKYGIKEMMANNQSWVLSRFALKFMEDVPKLNSVIKIKTWIKFAKGPFSDREFEIYVDDKIIAKATSSWIVINFKLRKVESLALDVSSIGFGKSNSPISAAHKINTTGSFKEIEKSKVKLSALDMIQHVSNLKYLDWAFDNINSSKLLKSELKKVTVNYIKELKMDDEFSINSYEIENSEIIKINKENNVTCFAAEINWK